MIGTWSKWKSTRLNNRIPDTEWTLDGPFSLKFAVSFKIIVNWNSCRCGDVRFKNLWRKKLLTATKHSTFTCCLICLPDRKDTEEEQRFSRWVRSHSWCATVDVRSVLRAKCGFPVLLAERSGKYVDPFRLLFTPYVSFQPTISRTRAAST